MPRGHYVRKQFVPAADRLFAKTEITDTCWLWTGSRMKSGHGQIVAERSRSHDRKLLQVHRLSWELHRGHIPEGLCVLHRCDVPNCVNPDHLFLGTRTDNSIDKVQKRRVPTGSQLPQSKLTEEDVLAIRRSNERNLDIAKRYKVDPSTISHIRRGHCWKQVVGVS
jgi:hypothetical protein